jgi:hypothetical protein
MIHYQLQCDAGHGFDGWFRDSAAFDRQAAAGLVECPACASIRVTRALMAPAIPRKGRRAAAPVESTAAAPAAPPPPAPPMAATGRLPAQLVVMLRQLRAEVERNCDYVGPAFAEEARKLARGDSDRRGIYGEASDREAEALRDEGIEVARLPWVPLADA